MNKGEVVVNDNGSWLTINDELDCITSSLIDFLNKEVISHSFTFLMVVIITLSSACKTTVMRALSQTCKCSKSIAVIARAHDNISRVNALKHVKVAFAKELTGSFPDELIDPLLL